MEPTNLNAPWRSKRFTNPATACEVNFNALADHLTVECAIMYILHPNRVARTDHSATRSFRNLMGAYSNALINTFREPGPPIASEQKRSIGIGDGWEPPLIEVDADGQTLRIGQRPARRKDPDTRPVFTLPAVDPDFVFVKPKFAK